MVEEDIEGRWESVRLTESEVPTLSVRGLRGAGELGLGVDISPGTGAGAWCRTQ